MSDFEQPTALGESTDFAPSELPIKGQDRISNSVSDTIEPILNGLAVTADDRIYGVTPINGHDLRVRLRPIGSGRIGNPA
jgi:hypothetical protein